MPVGVAPYSVRTDAKLRSAGEEPVPRELALAAAGRLNCQNQVGDAALRVRPGHRLPPHDPCAVIPT